MPCVLGSDQDFEKGEEKKSFNVSVTPVQEDLYPELRELKIAYRLAITHCSGVYCLCG